MWQEYEGVVVSSDVTHQLDGGWGDLVLLYVEPESTDGRRWLGIQSEPIRPISTSTISAVRAAARRIAGHPPSPASLGIVFAEMMQSVGSAPDAAKPTDRRVEHAVRKLRTTPETRASMSELAHAVGLSPSRLRHLFRSEIGMSAQSYVMWLRINEACAALARGASLSDAAYQARFSDAAHFTRTFRRTFGLAPSQVAGRLTLTQASENVGNQGARRAHRDRS
jgi:AraC-like DNA-binding protein